MRSGARRGSPRSEPLLTLALIVQEAALRTPDTRAYMVAAYLAMGGILGLYTASLLGRLKKAKED